ncbi:uncharacterized protein [Haliotis asinina]|uniref:uncharacterized protein n=1 Tax=Haliotis asinina TaxID=109174 RepID=UPI003531AFEF
MLSVVICFFLGFVMFLQLKGVETGTYFPTDGPSVWTKTYLGLVHEIEDGGKDAGRLYITTSDANNTDAWVNANSKSIHQSIESGEKAEVKLSYKVIVPQESAKNNLYGICVVSPGDLGIYFRDRWTFFQMRELSQLGFRYTVVSYSNTADPMLSVVGICVPFDFTKLTITFRDGVNVSNVLGPVSSSIKGQTVVLKGLAYRSVLKLESDEDLTGTIIESSNRIAVIAGAMSVDNSTRSVYLDHMTTRNAGSEYIVFGLPDIGGSDTVRVVAKSRDTRVTLDNNQQLLLTEAGDFADVSFSRGSFHTLTASSEVIVAIFLKNGGPRKTDMVVVHSVGSSTTSKYQFSIPSLSGDVNFKHYLVVTTDSSGQARMVLNGQALPQETVWFSISRTSHVGGYVPLVDTVQAQVISTTDGSYFNAYLMGYGDDATYGSALEGINTPQEDTSDLQASSGKTFCGRTGQNGNFISNGTQMEVSRVQASGRKRLLSYRSIHRTTLHLQACQQTCFLYSDCIGVNYKTVSSSTEINCDVIMTGPSYQLSSQNDWTRYFLK